MQPDFHDHLRHLAEGAPAERLFICPYCGGRARIDAGRHTQTVREKWWVRCWCYDCGLVESFNGVVPWPGIEKLTGPFDLPFTDTETVLAIHQLLAAGQKIQAIRLYREKYRVGLHEALTALDAINCEAEL